MNARNMHELVERWPSTVTTPSILAVSGAASSLPLIRKERQDGADHIQLTPSQLRSLRPVSNDVPDMNRGRWSASTAPRRRYLLRALCIRHATRLLPGTPASRDTGRTRGRRNNKDVRGPSARPATAHRARIRREDLDRPSGRDVKTAIGGAIPQGPAAGGSSGRTAD